MKNYFRFMFNLVIRKASIWVITGIYMVVLLVFGLLIPLAANTRPYTVLSAGASYLAIILLTSILSAILAGIIFRLQQDDGTELVVSAKPIERRKQILVKFLIFACYICLFSIIAPLVFCILFFFPQFSNISIAWIIFGTFIGNLVSMVLFGSIAIIISLKLSRVTMIVVNVAIVILISVYNTVVSVTNQTPSGQMGRSGQYKQYGFNFVSRDNNAYKANFFAPLAPRVEDFESYVKLLSLDGQKEFWNGYSKNPRWTTTYAFNLFSQLNKTFYVGGMLEGWLEHTYCDNIGDSASISYDIYDSVNMQAQDFVDKSQTSTNIKALTVSDDNPSWTNIYKNDCPATWYDLSDVSRDDTFDLVDTNQKIALSEEEAEDNLYQAIVDMLYIGYQSRVVKLATASPSNIETNTKYFYDVGKNDVVNTYIPLRFYEGNSTAAAGGTKINWQNIHFSDYEIDLFNWMLYNLLFANTKYYGDPNDNNTIFSKRQLNSGWEISLMREGDNDSYCKVNRIIYQDFLSKPEIKEKLNLSTLRDFGWEIMKFRYYSILKLTGQAGIEDYDIKNFNGSNVIHTVPWDAYFKCVYNTQFNSMNIANSSEFNEKGKQFIGSGIAPINNYAASNNDYINYLNRFVADEKYQPITIYDQWENVGINRLSPIYNGTIYNEDNKPGSADKSGNVDSNIFKAYDFSADPKNINSWASYPTLASKYGYISQLGLMASSFLNKYCSSDSDESSIYFNDAYHFEYGTTINASATRNIEFCNMAFNYTIDLVIPVWASIAIFISISLILMAIAYTRYIKHDFK